jgi:ADP-ribosyl-[dinitrogen reductase] hydrolase
MTRTSQTDPIQIATLSIMAGAVGLTFAPGKQQPDAMSGAWSRDLRVDLKAIKAWGATHVISLLEGREFDALAIRELPKAVEALGMRWIGLPIVDGSAPGPTFLKEWLMTEPALTVEIAQGARVLIHCKGGLGRAGTVAAMLLLSMHVVADPQEAMAMVRQVRPGAIETAAQEAFLAAWPQTRREPGPRMGRYIGLDQSQASRTCLRLIDVEFGAPAIKLVCEAVDIGDIPERRGALLHEDNLMYHPEGIMGGSVAQAGRFLLAIASDATQDLHLRRRAILLLRHYPTFDDMERMWRFNRPPKGVQHPVEGLPDKLDLWNDPNGKPPLRDWTQLRWPTGPEGERSHQDEEAGHDDA